MAQEKIIMFRRFLPNFICLKWRFFLGGNMLELKVLGGPDSKFSVFGWFQALDVQKRIK